MSSKFFIFFQLSDGSQRQNPGAASCQELWARMKSYEIGAAGRKACFWRDARILVPLASIQWTEWTVVNSMNWMLERIFGELHLSPATSAAGRLSPAGLSIWHSCSNLSPRGPRSLVFFNLLWRKDPLKKKYNTLVQICTNHDLKSANHANRPSKISKAGKEWKGYISSKMGLVWTILGEGLPIWRAPCWNTRTCPYGSGSGAS